MSGKSTAWFCVGTGGYRSLSILAADRMSDVNHALTMRLSDGFAELTKCKSVYWLWTYIWDFECNIIDFLYFDADVMARKPMDLSLMPADADCGLCVDPYLVNQWNAGVIYMRRNKRTEGLLKAMQATDGTDCTHYDQAILNVMLRSGGFKVWDMPPSWNVILNPVRDAPLETAHERHPDAVNLHYTCSGRNMEQAVRIFSQTQ